MKKVGSTMMNKTIWFVGAALLSVSCGGDLDCRHKGAECAEGFSCEPESDGAWRCAKQAAQPAAEGAPKDARPVTDPDPVSAPAPAPAETPCPDHPMCAGISAQCACGPDGVLLTRTLDRDGDGKPDEKAVYTNDREGRPTQVIVDEGMDGSADSQHSYEYNAHGDPVAWRIDRLSKASAEARNQTIVYVYDDQGNLVREETDLDIDEKIDSTCTYSPPCPPPIPNSRCKPICK
ncbi:MAG: hypothetical protein M0R80_15285 [Proteobacteria bacterium]|jgi:YD repeat-containing protein|nr:hypothetical protein [Pseudomonadota bacterium]